MSLTEGGAFGRQPPEYAVYRAAKALNCTPWDLVDRDDFWLEFALEFEAAEHEAQAIIDKRTGSKGRR